MVQLIILHLVEKKRWELPHLIQVADGFNESISLVRKLMKNQPYFYP
jgi:hypothetical protein